MQAQVGRVTSIIVGFLFMASCAGPREATQQPIALKDALNNGPVLYRSFDGEWIGTDIDSELLFLADGQLILIEHRRNHIRRCTATSDA